MCLVKTPKISNQDSGEQKPLPVLTNPILDGIDPSTRSLRVGRSSLRIRRNSGSDSGSNSNRYQPSGPRIMRNG